MSTQRYISTSFWDDPWICSLDPSEKFVYMYLMTNTLTNIAGVYEITIKRMCFDTGYNEDTINKVLKRFQDSKKAYRYKNYTILVSWPKHQKWENRSKIKEGIEKILLSLNIELLEYLKSISYTYPIDTLPIETVYVGSYSDLDSDIDIDIDIDTNIDIEEPKPKKPTKEVKHQHGEYNHVLLTDEQLEKLKVDFPNIDDMIKNLDEYIETTGKVYKNHNLVMRKWETKNKKENKPAYEETTMEEAMKIWER